VSHTLIYHLTSVCVLVWAWSCSALHMRAVVGWFDVMHMCAVVG